MTNDQRDMQSYLSIFSCAGKDMGVEITALKSNIQVSKPPREDRAREEVTGRLTTNYTAGPSWSAHIVTAASAPSNKTTFMKGPL